jgi:hypothetical protein
MVRQFQGLLIKPEGIIVIRNVNGHAAPIINDILALDVSLGFTEVLVVHHDSTFFPSQPYSHLNSLLLSLGQNINIKYLTSDCGATNFTNAGVIKALQTRMPAHQGLERIDFGAVTEYVLRTPVLVGVS